MKIHLYYIGRPKDKHANAIAEDFLGRVAHYCTVEMREINPAKFDVFTRHAAARKIFLDPRGKRMDSHKFSAVIDKARQEAQDLVFLIGAHDGLPAAWRGREDLLLSLSEMTWPHELARAMLAEQIYRAFSILHSLPYTAH